MLKELLRHFFFFFEEGEVIKRRSLSPSENPLESRAPRALNMIQNYAVFIFSSNKLHSWETWLCYIVIARSTTPRGRFQIVKDEALHHVRRLFEHTNLIVFKAQECQRSQLLKK
jgi:hypothetical protein